MQGIAKIPKHIGSTDKKNSWPAPVPFGLLVNENFASLANWTHVGGGTFSAVGGGLSISGGTGSLITDYLAYAPLINAIEKWVITVNVICNTVGSFATGIQSIQHSSGLNRSFFGLLSYSGGNYTSNIVTFNEGNGDTPTVKNTSTTGVMNAGDHFTITLERNFETYTCTITNLTTPSTKVSTWTVDHSTVIVSNVSGNFVLFAGSGAWTVSSFTVTSNSYRNPRILFVGDSLTHGANVSSDLNRYSKKRFAAAGIASEVNAGGNHRVVDIYVQLDTIKLFNPQYLGIMIGKNNVRDGQVFADFQSQYTAIRDTAVALGARVIHYTPPAENGVDMSALRDALIANFASDIVIDSYLYSKQTANTHLSTVWDTGLADGIHPNDAWNSFLSDITVNSIPRLLS